MIFTMLIKQFFNIITIKINRPDGKTKFKNLFMTGAYCKISVGMDADTVG